MTSFKSLMNLRERKALITGAAGYLGSEVSMALAELGADLILVDLPGSNVDELKRKIQLKYDVNVGTHQVNLEEDFERIRLIQDINASNKSLNVLVNNAAFVGTSGLAGWACDFEGQSLEAWNRAIEVNLTTPFHLVQGFSNLLKNSIGASVINIGSIYGALGPDWRLYDGTNLANPAGYSASKGGLTQLTRWMSTTLAPHIRVNMVAPGGILRGQPNNFISKYIERTPLGRMASETDFIGAIGYFSTDLSKYCTGQVLFVDGGWSVW